MKKIAKNVVFQNQDFKIFSWKEGGITKYESKGNWKN